MASTTIIDDIQGSRVINGFIPAKYNSITITYTGAKITTVTWYLNTLLLRTITLGYSGDNLIQVDVTA